MRRTQLSFDSPLLLEVELGVRTTSFFSMKILKLESIYPSCKKSFLKTNENCAGSDQHVYMSSLARVCYVRQYNFVTLEAHLLFQFSLRCPPPHPVDQRNVSIVAHTQQYPHTGGTFNMSEGRFMSNMCPFESVKVNGCTSMFYRHLYKGESAWFS